MMRNVVSISSNAMRRYGRFINSNRMKGSVITASSSKSAPINRCFGGRSVDSARRIPTLTQLHRPHVGSLSSCLDSSSVYNAKTMTASSSITTSSSLAPSFSTAASTQTSSSLSSPQQQVLEAVTILRLNNLRDNIGATPAKRRVGRGIGSSKGKTCGRGHKGQKARAGASIHPSFEGGQTPFWRRLPKRGFTNVRHATPMVGINIGTILMYIEMQRLDPTLPITITALLQAGLFKANAVKHGVKLLASVGDQQEPLQHALDIRVNRASAAAISIVEAAGGTVTSIHSNKLALRTLLRPEKFVSPYNNESIESDENVASVENGASASTTSKYNMPKHARPPPKLQPYYTNWDKRGYLNPAVQLRAWFDHTGTTTSGNKSDKNDDTNPNMTALQDKFAELLLNSKKKFGVADEEARD